MTRTVVVFDQLGQQAEATGGRVRYRWRCDCRIPATRYGRERAMRA